MAVPTSALQELTNKSIIELYSVELKADVHYTKSAKTATYVQSSSTITITLSSHGFSTGLILSLDFTSGNGIDGIYTIQTVDTNTFTLTSTSSALVTSPTNVDFTLSGAGQYVCDSWTKSIPYNNRAIINCSFREVFEP